MGIQPDPLEIPSFLKRDLTTNRAEFMSVEVEAPESRPAKTKAKAVKANGHDKAPVKAAGKPKPVKAAKAPKAVKTAPKATAKAAKAIKPAKVAKPRAEAAEKDAYGFRKGSAKSKAVALFARKNGATLEECKEAIGSVQLNALVALEEQGYTVERKKEAREGARSVTRYILKAK
jgi:hypothetical protein